MGVSRDDERLVSLIPKVAGGLESDSSDAREEAVIDLCKLSQLAHASAILEVVAPRLEHSKWEVRCSALQALTSLVESGNSEAVGSVIEHSVDSSMEVRKVAAALLQDVQSDDGALAASVASHLKSRKWEARASTLYLMGRLANREDASVIGQMSECFSDPNEQVRKAALQGLKSLAERGSPPALSAVVKGAADVRVDVRKAATAFLKEFGKQGDKVLIAAVLKCMEDVDWEVRYAACFALRRIAEKGNEAAISGAIRLLSDGNWELRCAAIDVLLQIAKKSTAAMTSKLAECIDDSHVKVRIKATKALQQLAEKDDKALLSVVRSHLESPRPEVRSSALIALGRLASEGNTAAISAAAGCLQDEKWTVRWDATRTLKRLACAGGTTSTLEVRKYFNDGSFGVQMFVAVALWDLAESGYGSAVGDVVALAFSVVLGIIFSSGFWTDTSQVELPYRVQEASVIWWLPCLIARVAAMMMLLRLSVKGFGSLAGTVVAVISAVAAGSAVMHM